MFLKTGGEKNKNICCFILFFRHTFAAAFEGGIFGEWFGRSGVDLLA